MHMLNAKVYLIFYEPLLQAHLLQQQQRRWRHLVVAGMASENQELQCWQQATQREVNSSLLMECAMIRVWISRG